MSKLLKYLLVILGTTIAAVLIYQFRVLLLLFVLSVAITATSRPLLVYLQRFRLPGFLAQLMILIVIGILITAFLMLAGPQLTNELQRLTNYLTIRYRDAYQVWEAGTAWQQFLFSRLPEPGNLTGYFIGSGGEFILPAAINITHNLATFLSRLFIVFTFSLYWAQDQDRILRILLSVLPVQQRIPIRSSWQSAEQAVGRYLRHEIALGLVAAVLLGTGYALFGFPYPIALSLLAFIGWFVPLIGFVIILLPVTLTAASFGWGMVLLSLAYTLLILMGLKYWLEPKYFQRKRYSSFLIVFWIVVLGNFLGVGGYLAGPVVAVATQAIWGQYLYYRSQPEQVELQIAALRGRYIRAYERYQQWSGDESAPQLGSIFERLERSLSQTEQLAEDHLSGS